MLERNVEQQKTLVTYSIDNNIPTLSSYLVVSCKKSNPIVETTSSILIPTIQTLKLFLLKAKSSNLFAGNHTTVTSINKYDQLC